MARPDAASVPRDLHRTDSDRGQNHSDQKQCGSGQVGHWTSQTSALDSSKVARVQNLHRSDEDDVEGQWHQNRPQGPPGQCLPQGLRSVVNTTFNAACDATHYGKVNQRNDQGGGEHEYQGHRQHSHELAGDAWPEQHRQECAERRRCRTHHRPEHAFGGFHIRFHRARTLANPLVGVFNDNDGAVDEHAHGKDQCEHYDI